MPDYKPSPRSGFPGSQKSSGGDDDWVWPVWSIIFLIVGAVGGIHSLSQGFEWFPQGLMFIGGVAGFWFSLSGGDVVKPGGCLILLHRKV